MCCALLYTRISNSRAQKHEFDLAVHNNSTSNKRSNNQLDEQTLWRSSHVFTLIFSPNLILTAAVKRALPASHTNEQTERTDGRADERICKQNVSMGGIMIIRLVIQDFSLFQSHFELHGVSDFGLGGGYPWTRRYVFLSADSKLCRSVPFRAAFVFLQINTNLLMFFQLI